MKTPLIIAISSACVAAALAIAPPAQAKSYIFSFAGKTAVCLMGAEGGKADAVCDVSNPSFKAPPTPSSCQNALWGDRITMVEGGKPTWQCHTDTLTTLSYEIPGPDATEVNGSIACVAVDNDGTKCRDTSTGNFFIFSPTSYQLSPPA